MKNKVAIITGGGSGIGPRGQRTQGSAGSIQVDEFRGFDTSASGGRAQGGQ